MSRAGQFPPLLNRDSLPGFCELVGLGLLQAVCLVGTVLAIRQLFGGESLLPGWTGPELIGLLAAFGVAAALGRWRERWRAERLAVDYVHQLRSKLFDAAVAASARPGLGVQMVRFSGDLTALRQWVSLGCARGISGGLFIAGLLAAIAFIHASIALAIAALLGLGVLVAVGIGLRLERAVADLRASRGGLANKVSEVLLHLPTIVASGRVPKERRRVERAGVRLGEQQARRAFWQGMLRAAVELSHRLCLLLVIAFGMAGLALDTPLPAADLLAVFAVVSLMTSPVRDLGRVYEFWKNNKVARANLAPLLAGLERRETPPARLPRGTGALRLRAGRIGEHLRVDSIDIEAGARVAITGSNGAGKSTLLRAIAGTSGGSELDVYLDQTLTRALSDRDRRRAIGLAGNDLALVDGSISKNLRYRDPRADSAALELAISDAGLETLLAELPQGLATRIGKGRLSLSQGQAARIRLARAVVGRPRLLLLDEIELGMDAEGRERLAALIRNYPGSVVYATHDDCLLRLAEQVWSLGDDRIEITTPAASREAVA